ncbi:MAG: CDP-alcohol phosphatidyltransferase family protein [Proteobacteria bacterium]|nr:CDP-alcohol phosphatidyltransferase family protein [Pseudomonadota bacterium]
MPVSLPNLITIARILLVPLTIWFMISDAHGAALASFVVAGISDAVDGFIARRFGLVSELGAYLDPLADKALLVSIYVTLAILKVVPAWLAILVVTRDVLIVGAVLLAQFLGKPMQVRPLWISKVNTTAQIVFAVVMLGLLALDWSLTGIVTAGITLVAGLTIISGALYLRDWVRHMSA